MILAIIIVLLVWLLWILGPYIRRWAFRHTARYMQDKIYRSMGLDPNQMHGAAQQAGEAAQRQGRRNRRRGYTSPGYRKIIPPDYGEPVAFETATVTGNEKWLYDTDKSPVTYNYRNELQTTDAQYTVIR